MPRAQAQKIAGAGHGGFGQPERINARITEFAAAAGADQARQVSILLSHGARRQLENSQLR